MTGEIVLGFVALLLLVVAGSRLLSRRISLPCPSWLSWIVELDNPIARSQKAEDIVQRLELQPGMRVLDAGCGPGRVTVRLARAVGTEGEVVALDVQAEMLRKAKEKAATSGLQNITFVHSALGEGKLAANRFDRALLVTVVGEIPNRQSAFGEIFRALKPGGILSVTEMIFDPHYQTRKSVLKLAVETGFREKAFFGNWMAYTLHLEKPR
jgi:ubiquinone/menaquinone biosynthesis C-methylase UbiE